MLLTIIHTSFWGGFTRRLDILDDWWMKYALDGNPTFSLFMQALEVSVAPNVPDFLEHHRFDAVRNWLNSKCRKSRL